MVRKSALVGFVAVVAAALVSAIAWGVGGVGTPGGIPQGALAVPREPEQVDETFYVVAYDWGWAVFTQDGAELDGVRVKKGTTAEIFAVNSHAQEAIEKLPPPVAEAIMAIDWEQRTIEAVEKGLIPAPEDMTIEEALGMGHNDHEDEHDAGAAGVDEHDAGAAMADEHDADAAGVDDHGADAAMADEHDADAAMADEHAAGAATVDDHEEDAGTADEHDTEVGGGADRSEVHAEGEPAAEPLWPYMPDHGFLIPWHGVVEYLESDAHEPLRVIFHADRPGDYQFVCTNYCGYGHKYMPRTILSVE